jgi:hypothetical protein
LEPTTGIEPVNLFLTKEVLYLLSYVGWKKWSGKRDSNPQPSAWKADALAIELFPLPQGNLVERGGFEPPKAAPADLQSAPFGRSGTSPDLKIRPSLELAMGLEPATC